MIYLYGDSATEFKTRHTSVALGKFDGIHLGHQLLIDRLLIEKNNERQTLVFTFGKNPETILHHQTKKVIYTSKEKAQYFDELGIDILLEYPFTKEFASMLPEVFVKNCLVDCLGVESVFVGDDFCFGKNRSGNLDMLKQLGEKYHFQVYGIPKKKLNDEVISSTLIRDYLTRDFDTALKMLGRPYFIYNEVVFGERLGNKIGFPTINQKISEDKVIPSFGVYKSKVTIDGKVYKSISNLGTKPTIEGHHQLGLETHILNFDGNLYGKDIKTELLSFVRKEMRFENIEMLKMQIKKDLEAIY